MKSLTREEVVLHLGETILCLQKAERLLAVSLKLTSPKGADGKTKKLLAGDRATLGQLLYELRKQVELPPDFEATLSALLSGRNLIVHSLAFEPWFDLTTAEGCQRTFEELSEVLQHAGIAVRILIAYVQVNQGEMAKNPQAEQLLSEFMNKLVVNTVPDFGELTPDAYEAKFVGEIAEKFTPRLRSSKDRKRIL